MDRMAIEVPIDRHLRVKNVVLGVEQQIIRSEVVVLVEEDGVEAEEGEEGGGDGEPIHIGEVDDIGRVEYIHIIIYHIIFGL